MPDPLKQIRSEGVSFCSEQTENAYVFTVSDYLKKTLILVLTRHSRKVIIIEVIQKKSHMQASFDLIGCVHIKAIPPVKYRRVNIQQQSHSKDECVNIQNIPACKMRFFYAFLFRATSSF